MTKIVRFTEIDLMRFLAAVCVMLFHYTFRGYASDHMTVIWFPALAWIFKYGYMGVEFFFMISGFVILMTAMDKSPREFLISRMVRLFPVFWVCVSITYLVMYFWGGARYRAIPELYFTNLTMIYGFFRFNSVDSVYWTLLLEIKFYLLIFLIMIFGQIRYIKYYLGLWLLASLPLFPHARPFLENYFITGYSSFFIAGAVFYLIYKEGNSPYLLGLASVSYLLSLGQGIDRTLFFGKMFHTVYNPYVMMVLTTLIFLSFFLISQKKTASWRSDRYLLIGGLTYPVYLLHSNIGFIIFNNLHTFVNHYILLGGTSALIIYLSYLIHTKAEKNMAASLKKNLEYLLRVKPRTHQGHTRQL